jgi:hypothetical protein
MKLEYMFTRIVLEIFCKKFTIVYIYRIKEGENIAAMFWSDTTPCSECECESLMMDSKRNEVLLRSAIY